MVKERGDRGVYMYIMSKRIRPEAKSRFRKFPMHFRRTLLAGFYKASLLLVAKPCSSSLIAQYIGLGTIYIPPYTSQNPLKFRRNCILFFIY
jgi:hypothetical protein